ncbi:MAG: hypothetical protein EXR69_02470 [Myxococcales bacterium]|nr:hypothetical protein [Myxococcales bacterium]
MIPIRQIACFRARLVRLARLACPAPLVLLAACAASTQDSSGTSTQDSSGTGDPPDADACAAAPDPARSMTLPALLARLDAQGCLAAEDQDAMALEIERFHSEQSVWCDQVYRLSSADGLWFSGFPELVRSNASVADVLITPDGTHVLTFVDFAPERFMAALRDDPSLFWRQGLVGLGGISMIVDSGTGFEDAAFNLHLASLQQVIDPDIGLLADGTFRLAWYAVPVAQLPVDSWDPYMAAKPHLFYRTTSPDLTSFPVAPAIVASSEGEYGEADPTLLTLADGAEVLYAGAWEGTSKGWASVDGEVWGLGDADVDSLLPAAGPDAVPDGQGGYRMYFVNTETRREFVATSPDGFSWTMGLAVMDIPNASGGTVARASDGVWWIYFNMPDPACVASVHDGA